jgi:hypothetical protein
VPEGSATPHMSAENDGSSEFVAAGQSKVSYSFNLVYFIRTNSTTFLLQA